LIGQGLRQRSPTLSSHTESNDVKEQKESVMKAPFLIGRLVFGGYFLYNAVNHFANREQMAQYAGSKNVPEPELAVLASGAALAIGGASILLGVKPKLGTLAVIGFLAGVSPAMHAFWKEEDPQRKQAEMINFTKNMALLGGALALMGVEEPWPVSAPVAQPSRGSKLLKMVRRGVAA
jgi:uncharacterized membrane protein YphA (DoxX/SURF4 family)